MDSSHSQLEFVKILRKDHYSFFVKVCLVERRKSKRAIPGNAGRKLKVHKTFFVYRAIHLLPMQSAFTCSKLTREAEQIVRHVSVAFVVKFQQISHLFVLFLLLTLNS